jgi:hypothetical protein
MAISAVPVQATFPDDNGRIAFRRFLNEDRTTGAVFTIRPNGTRERQVTIPPQGYVDRNPDISPDGKRIAFEREGVDCGPDCSYDEIFVVDVLLCTTLVAGSSPIRQLPIAWAAYCNPGRTFAAPDAAMNSTALSRAAATSIRGSVAFQDPVHAVQSVGLQETRTRAFGLHVPAAAAFEEDPRSYREPHDAFAVRAVAALRC